MNYIGIDIHKNYSVLSAQNESGQIVLEGRVTGNERRGFEEFFAALDGTSKAVLEACWNWGKVHDIIEAIPAVESVTLAHPYKTRIIAEAQIKTDTLEGRALALLLRLNAVPRAHVSASVLSARNLLSRPPRRKTSARGRASGSEGVCLPCS